MFTFFKRLLDRVPRRRAGLYPECLFSVVVTETEIVNHRPNGEMERVAFAELIAVIIETNDSGPMGTDVWWILVGNSPESGCVFPGGATGEQDAVKALQSLPGFDDGQLIKAMTSTDNARFVCWQATWRGVRDIASETIGNV